MMRNVCLYHGVDLDGFCSGAIYAKYMEKKGQDYELIPANYGWDLPWKKFIGAYVTLIDFSLQPMIEFDHLARVSTKITWIDHHKSAIDKWNQFYPPGRGVVWDIETMLDVSMAGCELAWHYYFPDEQIPLAVTLLGRYDVWDHKYSDDVLPFQYGMRLHDMDPANNLEKWTDFLDNTKSPEVSSSRIRDGQIILQYQRKEDKTNAKTLCYPILWQNQLWLAANQGGCGSVFFDSQWDTEKYVGMISFSWNGQRWIVGLYSDRSDIDCGAIAKEHGGGGHPGAAGFRSEVLPFPITETSADSRKTLDS